MSGIGKNEGPVCARIVLQGEEKEVLLKKENGEEKMDKTQKTQYTEKIQEMTGAQLYTEIGDITIQLDMVIPGTDRWKELVAMRIVQFEYMDALIPTKELV